MISFGLFCIHDSEASILLSWIKCSNYGCGHSLNEQKALLWENNVHICTKIFLLGSKCMEGQSKYIVFNNI